MAIKFDGELHQAGETTAVRDWALVQALGWWVAAELLRRHPGQLYAYLTGGEFQYDVLAVSKRIHAERTSRSTAIVWMNRNHFGHFTTGSAFDGSSMAERFNWLEVLLSPDRMTYVVEQIEREAGLKPPSKTPATTKESVGARVVAGFLTRSLFTKKKWVALNGAWSSGMGEGGVNKEIFAELTGMKRHTPAGDPDNFFENDAYRFWFLCPAGSAPLTEWPGTIGKAAVGFDFVNGLAWNNGPECPIVLMDRYKTLKRSVDALISSVCPPAY